MKKKEQEDFLGFILDKVADDNHGTIKDLLSGAFDKQDKGSFGLDDVMEMAPKVIGLLKSEHVDEVKQVMENFAKGFGKDSK